MSQNHRLIALKDDRKEKLGIKNSQNLKQIIFGIWINLKEEKPSPKKLDLDLLLEKNKILIYKKCLEFILLSDKIDTVYSPYPDQNIFLLVIFYYGMQCHYEVKVTPNDEDKKNINNGILSNFDNKWLVLKNKMEIDINKLNNNLEFDLNYDIENNDNNFKIDLAYDFILKKLGINQRSFIFSKSLNNNNNDNNKIIQKKENENNINLDNYNSNNYKDNLNEIFDDSVNLELDEDEDLFDLYNFPKPINSISKNEENQISNNKNNIVNNSNNNNNKLNNNINENKENKNKKIFQKRFSGISQASTNIHSSKLSPFSSKNSNINNNNISNQYSSIIIEQGEKIKKLQNQVERIELVLKEVLEELEEDEKDNNLINDNNSKFNKFKRKKNYNLNYKINDVNNTSIKLVDQSIKVPHIIYKELSRDDDE